VDALEISALDPARTASAIALWDRLLGEGRRITAVGTSDWHRGPQPIDAASVRVYAAELSERAVLDGIRAGRVVVMTDGRTPPPVLTVRCAGGRTATIGDTVPLRGATRCRPAVAIAPDVYRGARIDLVWNGKTVRQATVDGSGDVPFDWSPPAPGHLRVQVYGGDGAPRAVTNPIVFVRP
jgi:hypothetical protein